MTTASRRRLLAGLIAGPAFLEPAAVLASATADLDTLWTAHLAAAERHKNVGRRRLADEHPEVVAADAAYWSTHDRIMELPDTVTAIVAKAMLASQSDACTYYTLSEEGRAVLVVLRGLRPYLTGAVASTVDDYLADVDRPYCYGPLWGDYTEPGRTATELWSGTFRDDRFPASA